MRAQPLGSNLWDERWVGPRTLDSALHQAAQADDLPRLTALLDKGAPIESTRGHLHDGATPLHAACWQGNLKAVELLCARGAELDARATDERTPLIRACHVSEDYAEVAACLLAFGADHTLSQGGATALTRARERENAACVALLENASKDKEPFRSVSLYESDPEEERGRRLAAIVREARNGQPTKKA